MRRASVILILAAMLAVSGGLAAAWTSLGQGQEAAPVTSNYGEPFEAITVDKVRLDVTVGFGGKFRSDRPIPVSVTLESRGEDIRGQLIVSAPQGSLVRRNVRRVLHTVDVSLPQGGKILQKFIVAPAELSLPLEVSLVSNGRKIAAKSIDLKPLASTEDLVVLLQSGTETQRFRLRNWGYAFSLASPADMPKSSPGLLGVRLVVSGTEALASLGGEEVEALRRWIHMGGRLIVWGDQDSFGKLPRHISALIPVLPEGNGDFIQIVERRLGRGVTAAVRGGKDSLDRGISRTVNESARHPEWVPQYSEGLERSMYSILSLMPYVGPDARLPLQFMAIYLAVACAAIFAGCFDRTGYRWHFAFFGGVVLVFSIISALVIAPLVNEDKTYVVQVDTLLGQLGSRYVNLTSYVKPDSLSRESLDITPIGYRTPSISWVLPPLGERELSPLQVFYSDEVRLPSFGRSGTNGSGKDCFRLDTDFDFPIYITAGASGTGPGFTFRNLSPWRLVGCIINYRGRFAYVGDLGPGDTRQVALEDLSLDADSVIGKSSAALRGAGGRMQQQVEAKLRELILSRVLRIRETAPLGIPEGDFSRAEALFVGWVRSLPFGMKVDGRRPRESRASCLILRIPLASGGGPF